MAIGNVYHTEMAIWKQVPFSIAIGNVTLMECFPKHSRLGTARMKREKETHEKGKKIGVSVERSKRHERKKRSPHGLN